MYLSRIARLTVDLWISRSAAISSKVMGFNGSFPRKYPAWRFRIPSVIPSRVLLRCSTAFMMNLARFSFSSK